MISCWVQLAVTQKLGHQLQKEKYHTEAHVVEFYIIRNQRLWFDSA